MANEVATAQAHKPMPRHGLDDSYLHVLFSVCVRSQKLYHVLEHIRVVLVRTLFVSGGVFIRRGFDVLFGSLCVGCACNYGKAGTRGKEDG